MLAGYYVALILLCPLALTNVIDTHGLHFPSLLLWKSKIHKHSSTKHIALGPQSLFYYTQPTSPSSPSSP